MYGTIFKADRGKSLELSPTARALSLSKSRNISSTPPGCDRFNVLDISDDLEVH
jgi:hypothetical protein